MLCPLDRVSLKAMQGYFTSRSDKDLSHLTNNCVLLFLFLLFFVMFVNERVKNTCRMVSDEFLKLNVVCSVLAVR